MISNNPKPHAPLPFEFFLRYLVAARWDLPGGPIQFSDKLTLMELAAAPFFLDARLLLESLVAEGGTPATATGNLNRVFVRRMFDRMTLPTPFRESTLHVCTVINETDVGRLHEARIVCGCAGLLARRKKRFAATKDGHAVLPEDRAGEFYRQLFIAYFRRYNLSYGFHLRDVPGLQESMAVILWRLAAVARGWTPVRGLADQVLLPAVHQQLRAAMISPYDTEEWILSGYVLDALFDFGLIERKQAGEWPGIAEKDEIRTTALWRRFITFPEIPSAMNN